jgi:hypothetical protein
MAGAAAAGVTLGSGRGKAKGGSRKGARWAFDDWGADRRVRLATAMLAGTADRVQGGLTQPLRIPAP